MAKLLDSVTNRGTVFALSRSNNFIRANKLYGASDVLGGAVRFTCSLTTTRVDAMAMSSRSKPRKIPFGWSIFFNVFLNYLVIIYIQ